MKRVKDVLNEKMKDGDFSHDFDIVDHRNCQYDSTKGFNLDVDKLLGSDLGQV